MDSVLDIALAMFHGVLVLFNITGWMWRASRGIHLVVISLTLLSWFGLGIFYGWGYCPCTDWHWQVKARLGETDLPSSYIKYYVDALTGLRWNPWLVETLTLASALAAFALSAWLNWRDHHPRR